MLESEEFVNIKQLNMTGAGKLDKDHGLLMNKILECKHELRQKKLKKSGYNKHNKYKYFELSDFLPTLENILDKHDLGNYVYFENGNGYLTIYDKNTFVTNTWSTKCIMSNLNENGFDSGVYMKAEQSLQTYARRTLYVQAFELLETNDIELEPNPQQEPQKQKKAKHKKQSWQNTLKPQKQEPEEVTAERVQEIIDEAYEMMKDHYGNDDFEFSWDKAKRTIKRLCKNEHEYNICKQHTVFKTANKI